MNRDLFLSELRSVLEGSLSPAAINDNVRYYEEYIATEVRKGRSEEDVMEELGDPRLIARTLIDTAERDVRRGAEAIYDSGEAYGYEGEEDPRNRMRITRVSGFKALLVIGAIILIFVLVFGLIVFLVGSFIAAFWPALIAAAVIWWILNPNKFE